MLTWARLEGLTIEPPDFDDQAPPAHALATIEAAQAAGYVDKSWAPLNLLVLLFGIGLPWAALIRSDDDIALATFQDLTEQLWLDER